MSITVVIPSYKAEKTIYKTIESVLSSTINVNIIVIEDGVFDKTANIVSSFGEKVKLYSFKKNQGAQNARNFGLSLVNTKTVMFLDADDYIKHDFLESLYYALDSSDNNVGLAFGPMQMLFESNNTTKLFLPPEGQSRQQIALRWLRGNPGPHPCGILWKTEVVKSIGGWNESMSRNQDGEIILRALWKGHEVATINKSYSVYRIHTGERVSSCIGEDSFDCQQEIIDIINNWKKIENEREFNIALSEFCLHVSIKAYRAGLNDVGYKWSLESKKYSSLFKIIASSNLKNRFRFSLVGILGLSLFSKLT